MNVYAETNFVLEMALRQEQHRSCALIAELCKNRQIYLVIPAYSLAEPYETLIRRHRNRKKLKNILDTELIQLARTDFYTGEIIEIQSLMNLLLRSMEDEMRRLEDVRSNLINVAEIVPLNSKILEYSAEYQKVKALSPQDAIVFASVLEHLKQTKPKTACFLNKNSKDFDDPDISGMLEHYKCKLLSRFDHGYQFIIDKISLP